MGGERERRGLRDRALSRGVPGQGGGVGGSWGASCGDAWYWGGGVPHPSLICRVGVRRRRRLVVRVECLSRVGSGPGGPFGVDVVARGIRFLIRGG